MEFFRDLNESESNEFKQWARDNYKLGDSIKSIWHPVIQDECGKINQEDKDVAFFNDHFQIVHIKLV
jgi:hypothetical protein